MSVSEYARWELAPDVREPDMGAALAQESPKPKSEPKSPSPQQVSNATKETRLKNARKQIAHFEDAPRFGCPRAGCPTVTRSPTAFCKIHGKKTDKLL